MAERDASLVASPELVAAWLTARSVSRGLPQPVADSGGLRVDSALPTERRRYVFARVEPGLRALGEAITEPLVFLKLCGPREVLAAQLPPRWQLTPARSYMMTCDVEPARVAPPDGYRVELSTAGAATTARIVDAAGAIAARGHAAECAGVFAYDRIATDPAHQRKGLGRVIMAALCSARRDRASRQVLAATEDGHALYTTLGWTVHSLYSTAVIPSPE